MANLDLWVSCPWATGLVVIDDNTIIVEIAPVWRKFLGQRLCNLTEWLRRDVSVQYLHEKDYPRGA